MANITITLDNELLKRARIKAAELGTSVNAVLRDHLREWTADDREREKARAVQSFLRRARESTYQSDGPPSGRKTPPHERPGQDTPA
jgi:plasmid stability protein